MYQIPNLGAHGFVESKSGLQGWQILMIVGVILMIGAAFINYLVQEKEKEEAKRLQLARLQHSSTSENPSRLRA